MNRFNQKELMNFITDPSREYDCPSQLQKIVDIFKPQQGPHFELTYLSKSKLMSEPLFLSFYHLLEGHNRRMSSKEEQNQKSQKQGSSISNSAPKEQQIISFIYSYLLFIVKNEHTLYARRHLVKLQEWYDKLTTTNNMFTNSILKFCKRDSKIPQIHDNTDIQSTFQSNAFENLQEYRRKLFIEGEETQQIQQQKTSEQKKNSIVLPPHLQTHLYKRHQKYVSQCRQKKEDRAFLNQLKINQKYVRENSLKHLSRHKYKSKNSCTVHVEGQKKSEKEGRKHQLLQRTIYERKGEKENCIGQFIAEMKRKNRDGKLPVINGLRLMSSKMLQ